MMMTSIMQFNNGPLLSLITMSINLMTMSGADIDNGTTTTIENTHISDTINSVTITTGKVGTVYVSGDRRSSRFSCEWCVQFCPSGKLLV